MVTWPQLTSERSGGVNGAVEFLGSGDACKQVVAAFQLCIGHPGASQQGRGWDLQAAQDLSKISRPSCSSSRTEGKSGNHAGIQRDAEPRRRGFRTHRRPSCALAISRWFSYRWSIEATLRKVSRIKSQTLAWHLRILPISQSLASQY